jgi:hypothetical protein
VRKQETGDRSRLTLALVPGAEGRRERGEGKREISD